MTTLSKVILRQEVVVSVHDDTLHYRRIRGDTIETYKIVSGKYDSLAAPMLPSPHSYVTRGHDLRLKKNRAILLYVNFFY